MRFKMGSFSGLYITESINIKNMEKYRIGYLGQVPTIVLANVNKL